MITDLLILIMYSTLAVITPVVAIVLYRSLKLQYKISREFQKINLGVFNFRNQKSKNHEAASLLRPKLKDGNTTIILCGYDFDSYSSDFDQFIRSLIANNRNKSTLIIDYCPESTGSLARGISNLDLLLKTDDMDVDPIVELDKKLHYTSALVDNLSAPIPDRRLRDFLKIVDENYDNIIVVAAIHKRFNLIESALEISKNTIFYSSTHRSLSRYIYIKDILRSSRKKPYLVKL